MSMLCTGISSIGGIGLSVVMFGIAFGFIHPIPDTREWYHISAYIFAAIAFSATGIYGLLCCIDDIRLNFESMDNIAPVYVLAALDSISLGIVMACWFQKILENFQEKNWFVIVICHSIGAAFFIQGFFFIIMSIKSYRIEHVAIHGGKL